MTIRDYIKDESFDGDVVIAYYESGYYNIEVDLDFEIDEKEAEEFET